MGYYNTNLIFNKKKPAEVNVNKKFTQTCRLGLIKKGVFISFLENR